MGCDLVVALGEATADGQTLFGLNCHRPALEFVFLRREPGRDFALGEKVRTQFLELPQARKTYTALGLQPPGYWGYLCGVNQFQLALGCATLRTKLRCRGQALVGTDLVRLALERCRSARQAADLLADLVERHGQGVFPGCPEQVEGDHAFLIADPAEAFVVEAGGHYWVQQEVRKLRAVSDVSVVRQDWDRIAKGLAALAIDQGWWPGDGTKLDFAGALGTAPTGQAAGLRRWARATLLLEMQNGHIDAAFLRRLLSDHYDGTADEVDPLRPALRPAPLCRHSPLPSGPATVAGFLAQLPRDVGQLPRVMWVCGPPCASVYVPLFLDGELPPPLGGPGPDQGPFLRRLRQVTQRAGSQRDFRQRAQAAWDRIQVQLDQEAEGFAAEGAVLKQKGEVAELERRASLFMQHALEQVDKVIGDLDSSSSRPSPRRESVGQF
jgi:secernin